MAPQSAPGQQQGQQQGVAPTGNPAPAQPLNGSLSNKSGSTLRSIGDRGLLDARQAAPNFQWERERNLDAEPKQQKPQVDTSIYSTGWSEPKQVRAIESLALRPPQAPPRQVQPQPHEAHALDEIHEVPQVQVRTALPSYVLRSRAVVEAIKENPGAPWRAGLGHISAHQPEMLQPLGDQPQGFWDGVQRGRHSTKLFEAEMKRGRAVAYSRESLRHMNQLDGELSQIDAALRGHTSYARGAGLAGAGFRGYSRDELLTYRQAVEDARTDEETSRLTWAQVPRNHRAAIKAYTPRHRN